MVIPAATLATVNANVCITLASEPHWKTTSNDIESEAIRAFTEGGGNFFAQCAAITSYENNLNFGLFQSSAGMEKHKLKGGFNYPQADLQYSQMQGTLKDQGGSIPDYELSSGSNFINGGHSHVNNLSGPNSGPIIFVDGTPNSGLVYTYTALTDSGDDLELDDGSFNYIYQPSPDANGYDTNVTGVRVNPGGPLNFSSSGDPYFEIRLKTKIR